MEMTSGEGIVGESQRWEEGVQEPAAGSPGVEQGLQQWQAGWRDRQKSHDGDLESRTEGQHFVLWAKLSCI